jgi:hypothetical protein
MCTAEKASLKGLKALQCASGTGHLNEHLLMKKYQLFTLKLLPG